MTNTLPQDPPHAQALTIEEAETLPEAIEYNHSVLCALTLPRSRQKEREYIREQQGRVLKLIAGDLWDGRKFIPQPLPYGPKARLAFMHICSEAIKAQSPAIELERSARAFMERIGIGNDGRNYSLFRQQMNAIAACRFLLGYTNPEGKVCTLETKPIKEFKAWVTNDNGDQPALWASCLQLSADFFQDLQKHAVPLSANALRGLSHSALALDYYSFFAYRLHALEKPLLLPWHAIHRQLGQEYANTKDFKKESLPAIQAVREVYPSAKVEQVKGGLLLKPSYPPIARQAVGVSRGLADKVKASLPAPPAEALPVLPRPVRHLHPRTVERFRRLYPRLDVYACEYDFKYWLDTQAPEQPRSYDAAFLGFAKTWATQN